MEEQVLDGAYEREAETRLSSWNRNRFFRKPQACTKDRVVNLEIIPVLDLIKIRPMLLVFLSIGLMHFHLDILESYPSGLF